MDIAAIIGLKPLGKTYALGLIEDQIERTEVDIGFTAKSYGAFIKNNAKDTQEVSDEEHINFLMYLVSSHVLFKFLCTDTTWLKPFTSGKTFVLTNFY